MRRSSNPIVGRQKSEPAAPLLVGRKRDHSRDSIILEATIETLAEQGYERMTIDMVASRAGAGKATVYRRWSSKPQLVVEALAWLKRSEVSTRELPDTGTLRGDLLALFRPTTVSQEERNLKIMAGLASLLSQHHELAEAANAAIMEPWVAVNRTLMQRSVDRDEFPASFDLDAAAQIIPSMTIYRALIQRKALDLAFLLSLIDGVLLPAFRNPSRRSKGTGRP